jgi:two-component system CheB/CheR fusion protein
MKRSIQDQAAGNAEANSDERPAKEIDQQQTAADEQATGDAQAINATDGEAVHATSPDVRPSFIVGLGASAGGLEAVTSFFNSMPADSGLTFVLVQHLSPHYKSLMLELLSKHTKMPIYRAEDGMSLEPNSVYLITPKKNILVFHDKLLLMDPDPGHLVNLPIDIFFRSLAEDRGERAIGIVLSGTGSDGTRGVRAIKEAGGMVMVQEEASAKFDGMPRSALATGLADYILPPEQMPRELLNFVKHPTVARKPVESPIAAESDGLTKIVALIRKHTGTDFSLYKPSTVVRRIERRMSINQIGTVEEYVRYLAIAPGEVESLFRELLIGVTKFFREPEAFAAIGQHVLPRLFDSPPENGPVRVWVPACSTGEEAYSLAMLMQEYVDRLETPREFKIFATDIDNRAIETASCGSYPISIAADVSAERLSHFFVKSGDLYQVSRGLRERVIFAQQNIIKDPPFTRVNLVSCRNLLIYLQPTLQHKLLAYFHFALAQPGFLFLGSSETVGDFTDCFELFDSKSRIYEHRPGARPLVASGMPLALTDSGAKPQTLSGQGLPSTTDHALDAAYDALLAQYVPPSVLVDSEQNVLHVFGDISSILRLPTGKVSLQVLKMVPKDLSVALGTALHKATRDQREIRYTDVRVPFGETVRTLELRVRPMPVKRTRELSYLISFEETQPPASADAGEPGESFDMESKVRQRVSDLEQELQYTKENLQATIEELETSNEELQATNEELVASNEELQSTNEELQSVNEELYTVNAEYQGKIQELMELNADFDSLFASTDVAWIFLDGNLRVRKFTDAANQQFNLIQTDIGRPVEHISHNLRYTTLIRDARRVLETGEPIELTVQGESDRWYSLRLLPYRKESPGHKGVLVASFDVTDIQRNNTELRKLWLAVDQSPNIVMITNPEGKVEYVNRRFSEITGFARDECLGRTTSFLKADATDPEQFRSLWRTILEGKQWSGSLCNRTKDGAVYWERASILPISDEQGKLAHFLKVAEQIESPESRLTPEIASTPEQ